MKVLKTETEKSRIVQKWSFFAFDKIIARQRKSIFGWITKSWLYTNQCDNIEDYQHWFDWDEQRKNKKRMGGKQF